MARIEPSVTSPKPAIIAGVSVSFSTTTPSKAATAGLMYVMTVDRTGPTASISAANTKNAIAVQTIASVAIDPMTAGEAPPSAT